MENEANKRKEEVCFEDKDRVKNSETISRLITAVKMPRQCADINEFECFNFDSKI